MSTSFDDDGEWQDMPTIYGDAAKASVLDDEDRKRYHWNAGADSHLRSSETSTSSALAGGSGAGNATGRLIDFDAGGNKWQEKGKLDEMDYTRLELDDDPDEDEISMRTQYLFNEEKGMTPLAQMQTTKTLLTEGQRIAYVGLCRLVARELVQTLAVASKGAKELDPAAESAKNWSIKIMGRLYRHMEVDGPEQRMIEQLAEHGVTAEDLVPSLITTYTVDNPEYDPDALPDPEPDPSPPPPAYPAEGTTAVSSDDKSVPLSPAEGGDVTEEMEKGDGDGRVAKEVRKIERRTSLVPDRRTMDPFGQEDQAPSSPKRRTSGIGSLPSSPLRQRYTDLDSGDIGGAPTPTKASLRRTGSSDPSSPLSPPGTPKSPSVRDKIASFESPPHSPTTAPPPPVVTPAKPPPPENLLNPLPSSLPGVSTTLTAADKTITLDIRWTILCDLFLSLIADSVYDARSRVLMGNVATKLGLEWLDVVRFERKMTEALEIQEGVQQREHGEVLEDQRKKGQKQRYMMMGLATLGGGLVIGLSAGLLAPVIGAGLGAALTTVGVTGTTGFLAGAGGAAIVTSGATITGSVIGGKAMAKRTRHVKTFEFQPLHNNKRVNFYITVPGFMSGPLDDVRLPFSTIDPVMGDVFSVLWEPDMMGDTGNALKILTSEVLTQFGQQVLAMTVMTALLSALQWPMMLTKLGYLIDNPWSNALDRARQAGAVLADILINRHMGVRPVSLVGFSLGARVIFFALIELAKAKAFGVVQEVYLFGATLTASKKVWRQVRGVVSGRFVNAYAMNDWVLGYLFRATSGGLNTVAGLRPIEYVPDLENVDITSILVGHMSYRTLMPQLLAHVGFKTTADHFDEPDEMEEDAPDREVLTKEEAQRREDLKAEKMMKGGLFSKKKAPTAATVPATKEGENGDGDYDDDDDELPPRLDTAHGHHPNGHPSTASFSSVTSTDVHDSTPQESDIGAPPPSTSGSVGFDFKALRQEVADISRDNPASMLSPLDAAPVFPTSSTDPLDPREILRQQWAGESSLSPKLPSFSPPKDDWASTPRQYEPPSLLPPHSTSLAPPIDALSPSPSFSFNTSAMSTAWNTEESTTPIVETTPAYVWGQREKENEEEEEGDGYKTQNPW